MNRKITIKKRIVTYQDVEVNLIQHIAANNGEVVFNREMSTIDVRFPTMHEGCTNFVAYIQQSDVEYQDKMWLQNIIHTHERLDFLKKYEDHIVWVGDN